MELQKQIQEIHDSNLFGIIVETGAGACIASALYNIPGASKTIYFSEQPYNKIHQRNQKYLPDIARSISITFIHHTIKTLKTKYQFAWPVNINFALVSTFQLGDSTNSKLTHGYIGLYNFIKDDIHVIHLSIPENLTRPQYLEIITEAGITLLHNLIQENNNPKGISYVDKILSVDAEDGSARDLKIPLLENLINQEKETFLVFQNDSWNSVIRYEDFLRDKSGVILQKGSFNPLHHGHRTIFDKTVERYPMDFAKAFLISINNRDKASIKPEEVLNRINEIFKLGYKHVIVCKDLLLLDTADYHIKRWADKALIMPMGQDTLIRFVDDLVRTKTLEQTLDAFSNKYINVAFEVFDRKATLNLQADYKDLVQLFCNFRDDYIDDGISSTKLREQAQIEENKETEKLWKEFLKIS